MEKRRRSSIGDPSRRFIPLRYRFIAVTSTLLIVLLGAIAFILEYQQSRGARTQLERRALAMAQGLAATSKGNLITYHYIALEQSANQAVQDPETLYVVIHDKEGRVAGFSGRPDLQGTILEDQVSRNAVATMEPLVQDQFYGTGRIPMLDVAVPVFLQGAEQRWGTVRVALSLESLYRQIRAIRLIILAVGSVALAFWIGASVWAARRITGPLGFLVDATIAAAQGNLLQDIQVRTRDEVQILAENFSIMMREILGQREQLEHQLHEITRLKNYTEKLLATMSDGLIAVTRDGAVATMNPAASRMLGGSHQVPDYAAASSLIRNHPALMHFVDTGFAHPAVSSQQEVCLERGDEQVFFLVGSSLLSGGDNQPEELIVNLHDITQLKRLEVRMRQSERLAALGTLAAGMAHEIRNPLSAIKTFVQLLPRKVEKPDFLNKFQRTVPRELERINRLIEDLLELARDPKYQFRQVNVVGMVQQAIELFDEDLRAGNIEYCLEYAEGLPWVWADPHQLIKAFHNLLRNAIQAMVSGGRLLIQADLTALSPQDTRPMPVGSCWLSIAFADTGPGIRPENLRNIFNPFFTTKEMGTGLGLAITHKVVTEHHGFIEAHSELGAGSRFVVYLPVDRAVPGNPAS